MRKQKLCIKDVNISGECSMIQTLVQNCLTAEQHIRWFK